MTAYSNSDAARDLRPTLDKAPAAAVEKHGAILFCALTDDFSPATRIVLSRDDRQIENLPFGSVPLLRVTPIAEAEIEHQEQSDEWASNAARYALAERRIAT